MKYAVYLDYELDGVRNTVVLGNSIGDRDTAREFLSVMADDWNAKDQWIVDEDNLPIGYTYQTYYVASYDATTLPIGVK